MSRYLLCLLLLSCLALGASAAPVVTVPPCATAPTVDGRLSPGEWDGAAGAGMFTVGGALAPAQPELYLAHDATTLYLAARLPLPAGGRPQATAQGQDAPAWQDDALEIFLDPSGRRGQYYQFIVNAGGARYDADGKDAAWNGSWSAATATGEGFWTLEAAFPCAALKGTAAGSWAANFAWDCKTDPGKGPGFLATWSPTAHSLHELSTFGTLNLAAAGPAARLFGPRFVAGGKLAFSGLCSAPAAATVALTLKSGGAPLAEAQGTLNDRPAELAVRLPQEGDHTQPGEYLLRVRVAGTAGPLYDAQAVFNARPPLQVEVRKYWIEGRLVLRVDATQLQPARVRAVLSAAGGGQVAAAAVSLTEAKGEAVLDTAKLPPGPYSLRTEASAADGTLLAADTRLLQKPARPAWLGSKAGVSDEVLPPWTPLKVSGNRVSCWGRTYTLGALPLPQSVVTKGTEILAGPVTLTGSVGGRRLTWSGKPARCTAGKAAVAVFGCAATSAAAPPPARSAAAAARAAAPAALSCTGKVTVEYDGMMRTDLSLTPRGAQRLDALTLEVPVKAQYAKYLYHWPGRWGSAYNAGALPQEGYHGPFKPIFWLGDEWRGFCWFAESDRNFFNSDPKRAVSIDREGDVVYLRVSLVSQPTQLGRPLDYTFGFMATPVKPMSPSVWDFRYNHAGYYGLERQAWSPPSSIAYPGAGSLNLAQGTFECWVRPHFDPNASAEATDNSRGRLNRNFLRLELGNGCSAWYYWNIDARGMRFFLRQGEKIVLMDDRRTPWQAGEWHHLAFTWGRAIRLYMDGKLVAEHPHEGLLPGDLAQAQLFVGESPAEFDFDELRLSAVARESFDLGAPPAADGQTLLLDRFEETFRPDGKAATKPERGSGGVPAGGVFGPGKFGQALLLGQSPERLTQLDYLRRTGVRHVVFHEHWTDIQNYPVTSHGAELHSLVDACHKSGLGLLLYYGYLFSNLAPEWEDYHDECLTMPRQGDYHRQPEQMDYTVCLGSPYQDFLLDGLDKQLTEYGNDGVYLDGTSEPIGCQNTHHGCGYVRPDGTIGTTYPFFAQRRAMKRIRTIVLRHNPRGLVNVHQSTCMTIPTLSFADSYWDGEQFQGTERGPFALDVLPLDAFRAEFMGHNWGVPAEFLCTGKAYTAREALAFTLLHDVPIRGELTVTPKLWAVFDRFGRDQAQWLPYWENGKYVTTNSPEVKVSLYNWPGRGVLAVVSNLGKAAVQPELQLDAARLKLPAHAGGREVLTEQELAVQQGKLALPQLPSLGLAVVWVGSALGG